LGNVHEAAAPSGQFLPVEVAVPGSALRGQPREREPDAMDEVLGILIALAALIVGILVIGWAAGDFQRHSGRPTHEARQEQKPASS